MTKPLHELQKHEANSNLTSLPKDIWVSIDRLTVLLDSNQSLRRFFRELRQALEKLEMSFHIQDNLKDDTFTLSKLVEEDHINFIFFQLSQYGGFEVIRIDFNPNSLKEYHGQTVWRQILTYAKLNRLEIRLSRLDLAFDIFNRPIFSCFNTSKAVLVTKSFMDEAETWKANTGS